MLVFLAVFPILYNFITNQSEETMSEQLFFNGIDATTGEPLLPPLASDLLASIISKEERDAEQEQV